MTPRQAEYVKHRAAGLGQERAALEAGYAKGSAKVSASRMERMPAIRAAIEAARKDAPAAEYDTPQAYLEAVVRGDAPPDPVRVGAARALLPYLRARQRAPLRGLAPRQMSENAARTEEQHLLDEWATKARMVRDRMARRS